MEIIKEIAFKVVNQVLQIKAGQFVSILGTIYNKESDQFGALIPLLEELSLKIKEKGAFPVLEITTERLSEKYVENFDEEDMEFPIEFYRNKINQYDKFIEISNVEEISLTENIPEIVLYKMRLWSSKIWDMILKRKKQMVLIDFPSETLANYYDLDFDNLLKNYLATLNYDYNYFNDIFDKVYEKFNSTSGLKISCNHYELELLCKKDNLEIYSGMSNLANFSLLPSGKVEFHAAPTSIEGSFYAERIYFKQFCFENSVCFFEEGRIKDIKQENPDKNFYHMQNFIYDHQDEIQVVIGVNPALDKYSGYPFLDEIKKDNITLRIGNKDGKKVRFCNSNSEIKTV